MRRHRLSRPDRTRFALRVIANGDNEIHHRRARLSEFIPTLAAQTFRRQVGNLKLLQRHRMNRSLGKTSAAEGTEIRVSLMIQECRCKNGARRISSAKK